MSSAPRIRPGITSYLGAATDGALLYTLQALHVVSDPQRMQALLAKRYPDMPDAIIYQLITECQQASDGAAWLNDQLLVIPQLQAPSWGYDPTLTNDWRLYVVFFQPIPTSWYSRLLDVTGTAQPVPDDILRSIAAIQRVSGTPAFDSPKLGRETTLGVRDVLPIDTRAYKIRLTSLLRDAEKGRAPEWFQAAFNTAEELGLDLSEWGANFGAIISGVFRNVSQQ